MLIDDEKTAAQTNEKPKTEAIEEVSRKVSNEFLNKFTTKEEKSETK